MRERKLSWAIDSLGKKIFIEDLKKEEQSQKFNCPHCFLEVFPKRGEKKIWHFAHKGEECEYVQRLSKSHDKGTNSTLFDFSKKTVALDNMEFEDSDIFTCALCKKEENKEVGQEWSKRVWICKNCYLHLNSLDMEKLEKIEEKYC